MAALTIMRRFVTVPRLRKPPAADVTLAKRVPSPYALFMADFIKTPFVQSLKTSGDKTWMQQAMKACGEKWRVMSAAEKLRYEDAQKQSAAERKQKLDALSKVDKEQLMINYHLSKGVKTKATKHTPAAVTLTVRSKRAMRTELGVPKKPAEKIEKNTSGNKFSIDLVKKAGEQWRAMSDQQKEQYHAQYLRNVADYEAAMVIWKKKMLAAGHGDIIDKFAPPPKLAKPVEASTGAKK